MLETDHHQIEISEIFQQRSEITKRTLHTSIHNCTTNKVGKNKRNKNGKPLQGNHRRRMLLVSSLSYLLSFHETYVVGLRGLFRGRV